MPRISKHQRKFVAMEEASSGLKSRLTALTEELELFNAAIATFKAAPGDESGFRGPTVDLKKWLAECEGNVIEIREPLASSVFFTKIIMEALCAGTVSEKDLKAAVVDTCRALGIRSTGRGTISGLGIDVTTVCGVLLCLGITESTTITTASHGLSSQAVDHTATNASGINTSGDASKPPSMLQLFRNTVSLAALQQRAAVHVLPQASNLQASSTLVSENGASVLESKDNEANNASVKGQSISATEAAVQTAFSGLSSIDDYGAILQAELSLLQNATGKSLVHSLVSRWTGLLARYYQEARRSALRGGYIDVPISKPKIPVKPANGNDLSATAVQASVDGAPINAGVVWASEVPGVDTSTLSNMPAHQTSNAEGFAVKVESCAGTADAPAGDNDAIVSNTSSTTSRNSSPRAATQRAWKLVDDPIHASNVSNYANVLQTWMRVCYEEAAAKEMEECVVRRLAGQCNIALDNNVIRHGTKFLEDTLRLTADGIVLPHASNGTGEASLRDGTQFVGSSLWAKARRRYKRQHPNASGKHTMPLTHPYHQHGGSSEHFNYDAQALHLYTIRRAEADKVANSAKNKGKTTVTAWNDPTHVISGPYINPRYSLPVGWNRTDLVSHVNVSMQLDDGLYAALNQTCYPVVGTAIYPDLMIITSAVPWNMIAKEFMVMHAEDMDLTRDTERSPRMSGRSSSRGSFDFAAYGRAGSQAQLTNAILNGSGSGDNLVDKGKEKAEDNTEKGGSKRKRASADSVPSSPRKRSHTESEMSLSDRPMAMGRSQSSLGLDLQSLKDAEVFAPKFRESTFDIKKAVAVLKHSGYESSPVKAHTYIKIGTPGALLTSGGNGDSFARAALLKDECEPHTSHGRTASAKTDIEPTGSENTGNSTDDPFAAFSATSYAVEDLSDEAINFRHERVLKNMRDRWTKISSLKRERRMSLVGDNALSPRPGNALAHGSPRGSFSGGNSRNRRKSGSRSRASSGARLSASGILEAAPSAPGSAEAKRRGRPSKPSTGSFGSPDSMEGELFGTEEDDFSRHLRDSTASPATAGYSPRYVLHGTEKEGDGEEDSEGGSMHEGMDVGIE